NRSRANKRYSILLVMTKVLNWLRRYGLGARYVTDKTNVKTCINQKKKFRLSTFKVILFNRNPVPSIQSAIIMYRKKDDLPLLIESLTMGEKRHFHNLFKRDGQQQANSLFMQLYGKYEKGKSQMPKGLSESSERALVSA